MVTEAAKYSMIIENAQKADGIIREKYGSHKQGIEMLCMTSDKLKSAIPSASKIAALKDNPVSFYNHPLWWSLFNLAHVGTENWSE